MNSQVTRQVRWGGVVSILICAALSGGDGHAAEQFLLAVPGQPAQQSRAELGDGTLVITDSTGRIFRYERRPELDARAGDYLAFYCVAARQYLRWPAGGTGKMMLGESNGAAVAWRESQMQVQPLGRPAGTTAGGLVPASDVASMMHFAVLPRRGDRYVVAQIDTTGRLNFYDGRRGSWRRLDAQLGQLLPPGTPLALFDDLSSSIPTTYLADDRGRLRQVTEGRDLLSVPVVGMPPLVPGTHLAIAAGSAIPELYLVDAAGRLCLIDAVRGRGEFVDERPGRLVPGSPLAVMAGPTRQAAIVDRWGDLLFYEKQPTGRWPASRRIAAGFLPGTPVATSYESFTRTVGTELAAVDGEGRVRLLRGGPDVWRGETVQGIRLPPASPIALYRGDAGLQFAAIDGAGRWRHFRRTGDRWLSETVAEGFAPGFPVGLYQAATLGFAVDRRGRLLAAQYGRDGWICTLCDPLFPIAPTLVSRTLVPNPPLPPVDVVLANGGRDDLSVRLFDKRVAGKPTELTIPAGERKTIRVDRDAGAVFEETYLVAAATGEVAQQVHRYPLPPRSLYDVVVYADRVTSMYFDRTKNRSDTPDSEQKSLVSIGVFPLPPGDRLQQDAEIDVYGEAKYQENPGAAAAFGQP